MGCKPSWADSPKPVCNQRGISSKQRDQLKRILAQLDDNVITQGEASTDILFLLDYLDTEVH